MKTNKQHEIDIRKTNVFDRNLAGWENPKVKYIINQGGSSSGKTWAIMQLLVLICLSQKKKVQVVSSSVNHLKQGTMEYFLMIMEDLGIFSDKLFNKSDRVYTFPNGSRMEFISGSEPHKLKGPRRDILYVNEADNIPFESWEQLIIRTADKAFLDYNPSKNDCWIYPLSEKKGSLVIRSNYQDNTFLSNSVVHELNSKRDGDPNWYRSFVLGLRPTGDSRIYTHFKRFDKIDYVADPIVETIYGLDWGYSDPTAMVQVDRTLSGKYYVTELIYQTGLVISELLLILKGLNIHGVIYCDSANPDKIKDLRIAGFNSMPSNKSIKPGIDSVRESPIYIQSGSVNLWKEQAGYVWRKNGSNLTDIPASVPDHLLDAMRYAIHTTKYNLVQTPETFFF